MAINAYEILGKVVNANTGEGLYNLLVEAWDKDEKYNDLLGNAITNADGGFAIRFDSTYFREYAPDESPDIFFKIYQGEKLLKTTEEKPIRNAKTQENVTISIEIPILRTGGRDRVTAEQVFKAATFFQQSDFSGVYRDFRSKTGTTLGFVSDIFVNTFRKLDVDPIRPRQNNSNQIIGKDVTAAKENLRANKVEVHEVKPYDPRLNKANLSEILAFPHNLKPGQKVRLYEERDVVKYFAVVQEPNASSDKVPGNTDAQTHKVAKLELELSTAKQEAAAKEEQIKQLRLEMAALQKDNEEIKNVLKPENLMQLLKGVTEKPEGKTKSVGGGQQKDSPEN